MKIQKKAFIDKILLGMFLMAFTVVFLGAVSDELMMRNKYTNLKKVLQTTVLSAAKYYANEKPITKKAEDIALNIIAQTALGAEIKDDIEFEWSLSTDPKYVTATLPDYTENLFWFRLLHFDDVVFHNVSAKANIIDTPLQKTENFLPIAVNGCTQEFETNTTHSFVLNTADQYSDQDNISFFALFDSMKDGFEDADSNFTQLTTALDTIMQNKTNSFDISQSGGLQLSTMLSTNLAAQIGSLAKAFQMSENEDKNVTITVLDCGSTPEEPIVKELLPVELQNVDCAKGCSTFFLDKFPVTSTNPFEVATSLMCNFFEIFKNLSEDVFSNIFWTTDETECKNELFKLNFKVLENEKVQLEY